jgi:diadenosine tetraphosphate (Ap4A) HIT family hydrolase
MNRSHNQFSYLTAIDRDKLSFPVNFLTNHHLIKGRSLDFGCGRGQDVSTLQNQGYNIIGFDPYYQPDEIIGKFETIVCIYVLNVLFPEEQSKVIMAVSQHLQPGGKAYFAVRRDIKRAGFREHYLHKKPTYQCVVKLPFKSILKTEHCEIYEYSHCNDRDRIPHSCLFCHPRRHLQLLTESATAYAIFDGYPLSKGHALVIPKRHTANYFDLSFKEQSACWLMVNTVKEILEREFQPDGFNVGMNIDRAAGQTMMHTSIHIIPRYRGDLPGAKGGIRRVKG